MLDWTRVPQFSGFDLSETYVLGWKLGEDLVLYILHSDGRLETVFVEQVNKHDY